MHKNYFPAGRPRPRFLLPTLAGLALLATASAWAQTPASFAPVVQYPAGGAYTADLRAGDVNNDGRADIVSANYSSNSVGVLMGQTGGGFKPVSIYPTGTGTNPYAVELGDVNTDGRLDIVTGNFVGSTVGVLLGLTTGGFGPLIQYSTGASSRPTAIALGDVSGDGRLDIITANASGTTSVLLGLAGGAFAAATNYSTGAGSVSYDVRVVDVNGDGQLDIVTANTTGNTVGVLLGLAAGGFAAVTTYPTGTGTNPATVALNDVNGDGRLDIITANDRTNTVGVLLGLATGGFGGPTTYPAGGTSPVGVALGDMNGDGRLDLVTANRSTGTAGVLLGLAGGTFAPATAFSTGAGSAPNLVVLHDVNGDGRLDILTPNIGTASVSVLLNTGTFTPLATARPTAAEVSLAPNPARDAFTVQLPAAYGPAASAELLNALGQAVRRINVAGPRFTVETAGLAPGVYTLRLHSGGAALTKRVVVE